MLSKSAACVFVVAALALTLPGAAAGTVFGEDLSQTPTTGNPGTGITRAYMPDGSLNPGSPVDGILTSVTMRSTGALSWGWVRVLRRTTPFVTGEAEFYNVAPFNYWEVTADASSAGHTTTIQTRVAIQAGDQLALVNGNTDTLMYVLAAAPSECAHGAGAIADTTTTYTTNLCNHWIPLLQGTVEADADADGFGDETQDACPTDASIQVACPLPPLPAIPDVFKAADLSVRIKRSKRPLPGLRATMLVTVTNNGPATADLVVVSVDRARKLKSWALLRNKSCSLSRTKRACTFKELAPGASVTLKARAVKRMSGKIALVARVSAGTSDPVVKNNKSNTTVRFRR